MVHSIRRPFLRPFAALTGLGLLGVVALGVTLADQLRTASSLPMSLPVLVGLSLLTPTLLLVVAVAVGTYTAPRVGLRSHVYERVVDGRPVLPSLRPELRVAVPLGAATSLAILALDALFAPLIGEFLRAQPSGLGPLYASIPVRLLYGGITEELLLRWGLLSLLVWVGWRLAGRPETPSTRLVWGAIGGSALLFGVGHLPAVAASATLTPVLVVRTVLLNALAGVAFGWLYWRHSLEAAMVAHASFHVVLVGYVTILVVAFG